MEVAKQEKGICSAACPAPWEDRCPRGSSFVSVLLWAPGGSQGKEESGAWGTPGCGWWLPGDQGGLSSSLFMVMVWGTQVMGEAFLLLSLGEHQARA